LLDYDYFSGLATKGHESEVEELTTESTENTEVAAGQRLASQAGAEFSNPFTIELAQDSENTSPTRTANGPAEEAIRAEMQRSGNIEPRMTRIYTDGPQGDSPLAIALRAPYFMHPSVYHRGLHKRRAPNTALDSQLSTLDSAAKQRRRFRIGFFGTHDRDFYTAHYHFPGMNRFEILEAFFEKFGDSFVNLEGPPEQWPDSKIVVSIDERGGDRRGKTFLSQDHYFEALQECDFVLSPPGWCMPVSHNLIEAMFCGAIPITNGGAFMSEPLADDVNCLAFKNVEELAAAVERALAMDDCEVARMRKAVRDYYDRFLEPKAFGELAMQSNSSPILVNAEEHSVPLLFPGKF